jgi:proteic killer suppression protein
VIKSFRHVGIENFFRTGSKAGIQPKHAKRLRLQLGNWMRRLALRT